MALAVLAAASFNKKAHAVGALNNLPVPAFNDYGNRDIPFSQYCSSVNWTPIDIGSSTISRETIYEIPQDSTFTAVCLIDLSAPSVVLSSVQVSAVTGTGSLFYNLAPTTGTWTSCSDIVPGIVLSTFTSATQIFYDFSRTRFYCMTVGGNGYIKGIRYYDSGDWNNIQ